MFLGQKKLLVKKIVKKLIFGLKIFLGVNKILFKKIFVPEKFYGLIRVNIRGWIPPPRK